MPNHISNHVQVKSFDDNWSAENTAFKQLQTLMKTEVSPFDFNVLIPYPEPYKSLDDARNEAEKRGVAWKDLPKDGYNQGGHQWCNQNWGTKWNAYDIGFNYDGVYFNTAWATPLPIWLELSKRFPGLYLEVEYADEDRGNNCGRLKFKEGKQIAFEDMSEHPEAELFARAVIAEQRATYNWAQVVELRGKQEATQLASKRDE